MIKNLIPYEEALELKALGFNEPCITYKWDNNYINPQTVNYERLHYTPLNCVNHNELPTRVSIPTYSQAFRWFREKFEFSSHIDLKSRNNLGNNYYFKIVNFTDFIDDSTTVIQDEFKTYEEAELECLKKLIRFLK